jgi:hypothetical protein
MLGGRPDQVPIGQRIHAGHLTDACLNRDLVTTGYALVFWRGAMLPT